MKARATCCHNCGDLLGEDEGKLCSDCKQTAKRLAHEAEHEAMKEQPGWGALHLVGYQIEEDENGSPVTRHELRQCPDCKSTLAVPYEVRDPVSGAWVLAP